MASDLSVSIITSFAALLRDACPPFILARADPAGSQIQGPFVGGPHPRLLDASHQRRASHSGQHLSLWGRHGFPTYSVPDSASSWIVCLYISLFLPMAKPRNREPLLQGKKSTNSSLSSIFFPISLSFLFKSFIEAEWVYRVVITSVGQQVMQ